MVVYNDLQHLFLWTLDFAGQTPGFFAGSWPRNGVFCAFWVACFGCLATFPSFAACHAMLHDWGGGPSKNSEMVGKPFVDFEMEPGHVRCLKIFETLGVVRFFWACRAWRAGWMRCFDLSFKELRSNMYASTKVQNAPAKTIQTQVIKNVCIWT